MPTLSQYFQQQYFRTFERTNAIFSFASMISMIIYFYCILDGADANPQSLSSSSIMIDARGPYVPSATPQSFSSTMMNSRGPSAYPQPSSSTMMDAHSPHVPSTYPQPSSTTMNARGPYVSSASTQSSSSTMMDARGPYVSSGYLPFMLVDPAEFFRPTGRKAFFPIVAKRFVAPHTPTSTTLLACPTGRSSCRELGHPV